MSQVQSKDPVTLAKLTGTRSATQWNEFEVEIQNVASKYHINQNLFSSLVFEKLSSVAPQSSSGEALVIEKFGQNLAHSFHQFENEFLASFSFLYGSSQIEMIVKNKIGIDLDSMIELLSQTQQGQFIKKILSQGLYN